MLEDFPLEISQRLICLVGSMGTRVVMQEQQWEAMMFKRAEQMEVAWSKVRAIQRMLEDFPLEISRLLCLVVSMGTCVVMQEQQWEVLEQPKEFYAAGFQGLVK
jgi:hypothetical protein